MEDYQLKYANPINPFTFENILHHLNEWHSNTKEEIEIYIYLTKELKNDTLNRYPNRYKSKALTLIDKLKKVCQSHMKCICEYLIELQHKSQQNISEERIYLKLEAIRSNYNNMLLNNQKFILSMKFLIELKNRYLLNKKELQLSKRITLTKNNSKLKFGLNSSKINIDYDIINQHTRNIQQNSLNYNYTNYIAKNKRNVDSYKQKTKFNSYISNNKNYANVNQVKKIIKHSRSYINPNVRNGNGLNERLIQNVSYNGGNKKIPFCNKKHLCNKINNNYSNDGCGSNISLEFSMKDKIVKENIELHSEMKNIKSQLNIMNETIKLLSEKVEMVQKENVALKQHNQNLSSLLKNEMKLHK